jgi:hypothetical protein
MTFYMYKYVCLRVYTQDSTIVDMTLEVIIFKCIQFKLQIYNITILKTYIYVRK